MTLSSIEWLTAKLEVSGSGSAATSRSNVGSPHDTKPSGGFLRTILRRFFGSSPALRPAPRVLDHVLGRLHHDGAGGVEAGAAGPAGDLVELARLEEAGAGCRRTWSAR